MKTYTNFELLQIRWKSNNQHYTDHIHCTRGICVSRFGFYGLLPETHECQRGP